MKPAINSKAHKIAVRILTVTVTGFLIFLLSAFYVSSLLAHDKFIKVVAVGDSLTQGVGVSADDYDKYSYPAQLQKLLGDKYQVSNYGVGGRSLLSSDSLPYSKENFYKSSLISTPAIVLIMLGTNDSGYQNWSASLYEKELTAFVNVYKNLPSKPTVYLLTIPPAFVPEEPMTDKISGVTIKKEVVPIIKRVAKTTNTPVIDIYEATKNHSDLFIDGVHLDKVGYEIIAKTVYEAIK